MDDLEKQLSSEDLKEIICEEDNNEPLDEAEDYCIYREDDDSIDDIETEKIKKEFEEYNNKSKIVHEKINNIDVILVNNSKHGYDGIDLLGDENLTAFSVPSIFNTYFGDVVPQHTYINISGRAKLDYIAHNRDKIKILNIVNRIGLFNKLDEKNNIIRKKNMLSDKDFIIYNSSYDVINNDKNFYSREIRVFAFKMDSILENPLVFITTSGGIDIYSAKALMQEEVDWLVSEFAPYMETEKESKIENMNYIFANSRGDLFCNQFNIEKADIDVDLHYNEDFRRVSDGIVDRLNNQDKGLVILAGIKGSGKTYYLRWLTKNVDKKFIYVPRYFYNSLSSTTFFNFLINHCRNSVLVFEDAEEIVKKRDSENGNYLISDILEMSDGLMNDILKVQMIFTFNMDVNNVDEALLRPSRLLARYNFGKLCLERSNKLLASLGKNVTVNEPKTLAELYNIDNMPIVINNEVGKKFGFQT